MNRASLSLSLSPRQAIRSLVAQTLGPLPALEFLLKLRALPGSTMLRLHARREVRRLKGQLNGLVSASVVTVIPTYRRPEMAEEALDSALAQDYGDHRILLVDDGAGVLPICHDQRVTMVSLSRNLGVAGAVRNVGIALSSSRYVAFLDDDNIWHSDHLSTTIAALEQGADVVYTAIRRVRPDGSPVDEVSVPFERHLMRTRSFIDTSAIVVRRSRKTRFSWVPRGRGTVPGEDWEFAYRLSRRHQTVHLPQVTVEYLVHELSYFRGQDESDPGPG